MPPISENVFVYHYFLRFPAEQNLTPCLARHRTLYPTIISKEEGTCQKGDNMSPAQECDRRNGYKTSLQLKARGKANHLDETQIERFVFSVTIFFKVQEQLGPY